MEIEHRDILTIEIPIYGQRVILCRSFAAYEYYCTKAGSKVNVNKTGDGEAWQTTIDGLEIFSIYVGNGSLGVLVHEIAHTVFNMSKYLGLETTEKKNEPYCYLMQYLFDESKEFISKNCRN